MTGVCIIVLVIINVACSKARYVHGYATNVKQYTEEIVIKQGALRGVEVEPRRNHNLPPVEQYLGLPYALPPVGEMRFMPPGSAPPWRGTLIFDTFGPVCPQKIPEIATMSTERRNKFKLLAQHLTNQSEDCLYLNIYAPFQGKKRGSRKYPVMVYIHGESYEWNSGSLYDGSVLASHGKVIVVTINYRLGILGFLKAGLGEQARSNFGLVDQVAALLWVQENIAAFGGDPNSVTLFGHGTGAACVNFLMLSPMVTRGTGGSLFHRAILMSGTALADWALSTNSLQLTTQVAQKLNCPLLDDVLASCLRKKRLIEIMNVSVMAPRFKTTFGPIVDGLVIPNEPKQLMTVYNDLFSKYDLMYGISQLESDQLLGDRALAHGVLEKERDDILRAYLQARFEYQPEAALASTLSEYTDLRQASTFETRDTLLEMLSDARVTAPIVQMANYHSEANPRSYFYVFGHSTESKEFMRDKSLHGEELPYVFGVPLDGSRAQYTDHYTQDEKLFSEAVMSYFTNFAHTGRPDVPHRSSFLTMGSADWQRYDIDWPEYDSKSQPYMLLVIPPTVEYKYRNQLMQYWNNILPSVLKNHTNNPNFHKFKPTSRPTLSPEPKTPARPWNIPEWINPRPVQVQDNSGFPLFAKPRPRTTSAPAFGTVHASKDPHKPVPEDMKWNKNQNYGTVVTAEPETQDANTALNIVVIVGALFLIVNVIAFAGLYIKRRRLKTEERNLKRQYEDTNLNMSEATPKKTKLDELPEEPQKGCNVIKMLRQSTKSEDTYEAVKASEDSSHRFKLTRQISSSTIDPHTKVRDWIAHEIVHRCSPKFLRRTKQQLALEHKLNQQKEQNTKKSNESNKESKEFNPQKSSSTSIPRPINPECNPASEISMKTDSKSGTRSLHKPKKVSVAIDATPAARSNSILKQEPIEIAKSLELYGKRLDDYPLRRSVTLEDIQGEKSESTRRSTPSINLAADIGELKIEHFHSRSDPVQITLKTPESPSVQPQEDSVKLTTFDPCQNVNVTCREEPVVNILTPEEALQTIKRRNFPKVLPDLPEHSQSFKRRSLPPSNFLTFQTDKSKVSRLPPAPPPRTTSTLGRKPSNTIPICPSPLRIAEEPPSPPEPTISSNTLHVGPLIPQREPRKYEPIGKDSYQLNTQPIYDNLRTPVTKKPEVPRPAKTIITADPDQPFKKVEPKVIIKPSTSKRDNSKVNKVIPRVMAQDNNSGTDGVGDNRSLPRKLSFIPMLRATSKSSSDSSTSTTDGSDTGTVVKK